MTHLLIKSHLVDNLNDDQHCEDLGLEHGNVLKVEGDVEEGEKETDRNRKIINRVYAISQKMTHLQIKLHLVYNLNDDEHGEDLGLQHGDVLKVEGDVEEEEKETDRQKQKDKK
jgi:hypothetical protein